MSHTAEKGLDLLSNNYYALGIEKSTPGTERTTLQLDMSAVSEERKLAVSFKPDGGITNFATY